MFVHHGGTMGGSPSSLLQLINEISDKINPTICCALNDESVVEFFKSKNINAFRINLPMFDHTTLAHYKLTSLSDLKRLSLWIYNYKGACNEFQEVLKKNKPDIIHFNSITLAPYVVAAKKENIKSIIHVREPLLHGLLGIRKHFVIKNLNLANEVIAICHDNLERLSLEKKGIVIYNPVNFEKFNYKNTGEEIKIKLPITNQTKIICYVGGSHPVKGPDLFLKSIRELLKINPKANIYCVTPSLEIIKHPGKTKLRKIIYCVLHPIATLKIININKDIKFLVEKKLITTSGFTHNIEDYIAASNIICVTHSKPHFARVVMEAGAMKKPVVCFDVGGVSEVVVNQKTGLIIERFNTKSMAQLINKITENSDLESYLGDNAFQQASNLFKSSISAKHVFETYEKLNHD